MELAATVTLKLRLMLVVLAVSWVPLGVVVGVLSSNTEAMFQSSHAAQHAAAARSVGGELMRATGRIDVALQRLATDRFLEESLVQPLERGVYYQEQSRQREVVLEAKRLVRSADVQTLRLVDMASDGRVIALGHRAGDEAPDPEAARWAREAPGSARFRFESVETDAGALERVWTLQVARAIRGRVALVGGAVLTKAWLEALLKTSTGGAHAVLETAKGEEIAATFAKGEVPKAEDFDELSMGLAGGGDAEIGTLRIYVDRGPLRLAVRELWMSAALVALLTALFALLVGWWTSRRLARPLERLAMAAGAIAAGARDERVPEVQGRDEVASLTRAFNRMTRDLSESEERLKHAERVAAWQEIARRIAHEIKNPLFPIQMSIETLQKVHERKHPDFEEVFEESTQTILEEVERMGRIVTEFRDFARLPAPVKADVDLSSLLRGVVALHQDVSAEVDLRWQGPAGVTIVADADQLTSAATNLVKNAIEAHGSSPPSGAYVSVELVTEAEGDVRWKVVDNGPGMPEEVRTKLFTPYFTTKSSGTGLGLAITHRIVVEHGARIQVVSVEGEGTRFEIHHPSPQSA